MYTFIVHSSLTCAHVGGRYTFFCLFEHFVPSRYILLLVKMYSFYLDVQSRTVDSQWPRVLSEHPANHSLHCENDTVWLVVSHCENIKPTKRNAPKFAALCFCCVVGIARMDDMELPASSSWQHVASAMANRPERRARQNLSISILVRRPSWSSSVYQYKSVWVCVCVCVRERVREERKSAQGCGRGEEDMDKKNKRTKEQEKTTTTTTTTHHTAEMPTQTFQSILS